MDTAVNINGAINLETKQIIYVEDEKINVRVMISLLLLILQAQKEGKIHIILDNAKYYHAKIADEFLKNNPGIKLYFLPAYSPNLNIIERLWHILKKEVVYNKFYVCFNEFKEAVLVFFEQERWIGHKLEKMLTDNFHILLILIFRFPIRNGYISLNCSGVKPSKYPALSIVWWQTRSLALR